MDPALKNLKDVNKAIQHNENSVPLQHTCIESVHTEAVVA